MQSASAAAGVLAGARLGDPTHERHSELVEWIGGAFDPDDFHATTIAFGDPKKRWKIAFEDFDT